MAKISFNSGTQEQLNGTALKDGLIYINTDAQCLTVDSETDRYYFNTFIVNDENMDGIEDGVYSINKIQSTFIPYSRLNNYCTTEFINTNLGVNTQNISLSAQIKNIYDATAIDLDSSQYTIDSDWVAAVPAPLPYMPSSDGWAYQKIIIPKSNLKTHTKLIVVVSDNQIAYTGTQTINGEIVKILMMEEGVYDAENDSYVFTLFNMTFSRNNVDVNFYNIYKIFII